MYRGICAHCISESDFTPSESESESTARTSSDLEPRNLCTVVYTVQTGAIIHW